jgi:hypothetical protein
VLWCFLLYCINGGERKRQLAGGAVRYSNKDFCPPPLTETKGESEILDSGRKLYTLSATLQNTYEHEIVPYKYGNFVSLHGCLFLIKIIRLNNQQNNE